MLNNLIEQNYNSIVARGLITEFTKENEFLDKIQEEFDELKLAVQNDDINNKGEEMADIILTVLAYAKHHYIDIENELVNKIDKNFKIAIK